MSTRLWILRSGEIVEWDEADRDPWLIGNLAWTELQPESPLKLPNGRHISTTDWNGSDWGELVADCPCEDCQAQRAAALN